MAKDIDGEQKKNLNKKGLAGFIIAVVAIFLCILAVIFFSGIADFFKQNADDLASALASAIVTAVFVGIWLIVNISSFILSTVAITLSSIGIAKRKLYSKNSFAIAGTAIGITTAAASLIMFIVLISL